MAEKTERSEQGGTLTRKRTRTRKPPLYKVLLHNDDYTPMDFVVAVLMQIFRRSETDAITVMLHVHNQGVGLAGTYTYEIAETKLTQVLAAAKQREFPLQCSMEPE